MTFSPLTSRTVPHHNKFASRQGRPVTRMIIHHWAGTVGGDSRLVNPNADVSANYILYSDGTLVGQVPEEYRAWTSGSWEADSYSITVEVQNSAAGGEWPVSDRAIAKLIDLIADVARRYRWGSVNRDRVRGHREFAATACPGPYLWNRLSAIATQANTKLNGGGNNPPAVKKGTQVLKHYERRDKTANGKGSRSLGPGNYLYLNQVNTINSQATNIIGGAGQYSITPHLYAEGTPGDAVDLVLIWQTDPNGKPVNSSHYTERAVFDKNGLIRVSPEFKRYAGGSKPQAVYLRAEAPKTNTGPVKITLLASDAYLFN